MTEKKALCEGLQKEDYYIKSKRLVCHLEILDLQERYIKDELADLRYLRWAQYWTWGMDTQKREVREVVELPLTHFYLYKKIGISPPRGLLLYGPPGTGKTMLVKAVAHHTSATFIRVVGSEFVQKYLGEGPRMVRDVFRLARENSPAIIFRLMQLRRNDSTHKQAPTVIMATNRADTLDPALLRPGRLDRKIEFPLSSRREKRLIFQTITSKMNLGPIWILRTIASICQAAGLQGDQFQSPNGVSESNGASSSCTKEPQTVKRADDNHEFLLILASLFRMSSAIDPLVYIHDAILDLTIRCPATLS
ncbi:hypothetical protein BS47DRAFT_1381097 [Hydnum rufescens UP504]|uniref:AAA+ ATPase domain-containing protein n=1 Tax=Hydnum rufescens UP504 TaxID=1448309 RepID=A0A9P6B289_9AGAM|nr:hypothetical protein BS47DRAFT_1381097 [Hydnum rufescens UP504]